MKPPVSAWGLLVLLVAGLTQTPANASNYNIYYQANNIADLIAGQDLWQYQYQVSGPAFLADQGFDIFFPVQSGFLAGDLQASPNSPNVAWDVISIQPDLLLPQPQDGFFEGYALQNAPSLNDWFLIDFIWRGAGAPGPQAFNIFDTDFSVLETGITTLYNPNISIPEPATWLLLLPGFYALKRSRH